MEDKSRMARSPMPRSKPGPRRRKMKAMPAPGGVRKPNNRLPHSPAPPTAPPVAVALPPPYPYPAARDGKEGGPPQPVIIPPVAPNPDAFVQPAPAEANPYNIDVEALTKNMARLMEEGGHAVAAYLRPRDNSAQKLGYSDEITDAVRTIGQVAEYWYADPQRAVEMQTRLGKSFLDLFANASRRLAGESIDPVVRPDPRDKRFSDPEWSSNQYFNFLKQAYLIIADWAKYLVEHADQLDPAVRQKAEFYTRQIVNALAPSNFILTNPELLRTTLNRSAENLVRGTQMLAEDIEAGGGELKLRQSDMSKFEVGPNLSITPGKVIYQNALMQLIQYTPSTERVLKRPLLIVPPWINKYYVLDLTPEKSLIKWCVDQGLTVFAATEEQVGAIERQMTERGYLEGSKMATAFNLLRSNDLIWPYVINNYLKGEAPFAFDLLYWNSDATRMPAANHSYYLRNCYLDNNITKSKLTIDNVRIDLKEITIPIYNLATREDHIAPAKSVYLGSTFFGRPMRYVLSGSGHIAGVVNPPAKTKYQYWTGDTPRGEDVEGWLRNAAEHPGSWWPDWLAWIKAQDAEEVEARPPGGGVFAPIEDAPGSYVKLRS